eukprot:CAMPEP_0198201364 /NCGR_PEP_ID=MMETSP1445-20131203/4158_1 /TAXON_ID=36898 /ORGANISM="Pyramimonas sp., Strain CCMP2087" /LENGTH=177 /DNA_ID=CAMNT_0043871665 /DNA_START=97 /DNA_END=630 /DNA_ORIENTATION=-
MPINWPEVTAKLPSGRSDEEKAKRKELFKQFDPNGNGYLSLAEVDKGVRDVLGLDDVFNCKPAVMRAFQASKGIHKSKSSLGEDFIERIEFRMLLLYLRQYFELYVMFDEVDTSDDRRVDKAEFDQALGKISSWGLQITDPDAEFAKIDTNGGGMILFDEFADWALKMKLDLEDDDE